MLHKLERKKTELLAEYKQLANLETRSDSQEERATNLDKELTSVTDRITQLRKIEEWEKSVPTEPTADYQRAKDEFSIVRLINSATDSSVDAGLEKEVCAEAKRSQPAGGNGYVIPHECLQTRAISTASSNFPTQSDFRPDQMIPLLRNKLVTRELGARYLTGLTRDISIPKLSAAQTVGFKAEAGALDASDVTFDSNVTLSPHKMGVISEWSLQAAMEANLDLENLIRDQLVTQMAHKLESTFLYSDGVKNGAVNANAPKGIIGHQIGDKSFSQNLVSAASRGSDTNGLALTKAHCRKLMTDVESANAYMAGRSGWLTNSKVKAKLVDLELFSSTDSRTVYENGSILGERCVVSNVVRSDLKKGTGTGLSAAIYSGDWNSMVVGMFGGLELLLNPYRDADFKKGSVALRAMQWVDVAVLDATHFGYYNDIITT